LINAFNFIDGIDGLASTLALSSVIGPYIYSENYFSAIDLIFITSLLIVTFYNFSDDPKNKIFLGDAGSNFIGFFIAITLLQKSQPNVHNFFPIQPVEILWIVAIPLLDFYSVILRRWRKKIPITSPDRTHIHHIFIRVGFSNKMAVVIITSVNMALLSIGMVISSYGSHFSILAFISAIFLYNYFMKHAWVMAKYLKS